MKFAFFFPGQGSQSVGMMQGLTDIAIVRETFAEASDVLGQDFWAMVTEPNEALNQTSNTQPLMLTAGVATWRAWQQASDLKPHLMAGHSLGEYTALVAAGALSFKDALPLVRYRAQVMQNAVAEGVGAMAAILGLDDDTVRQVCTEAAQGEVVEAVNLNSPGQVVIAGNKAAVERGMELAKEKGAKRALPLPVSVPSHCALMKPAALELAKYLESVTITAGQMPVVHNADVAAYDDAAKVKDALVRQLFAGLTKRIVADLPCVALVNQEAFEEAKTLFLA